MNDPNRSWKWFFVVALIGASVWVLYPPSRTLKGGIDLVGGTSLLFEIDTSGLNEQQKRGLSEKVMGILKDRVDPNGQLNLEWRPVGNSRLEIRMPRPPKEAAERRKAYNDALDALASHNISRRQLVQALSAPANDRQAKLDALVRGVSKRKELLKTLAAAYDKYSSVRDSGDPKVIEAASKANDDAMQAVLDTNIIVKRLEDVLSLTNPERRAKEIAKYREKYPAYDSEANGKLLTKAIKANEAWSKNKGDLEDPSDLKRRLRGAGVLTFRILADRDPSSPGQTTDPNDPTYREPISRYADQLAKYGPRKQAGDKFIWLEIDNPEQFLRVDDMANFDKVKTRPGMPIVEEYAGKYYVLSYDDKVHSMLDGTKSGKPWKLVAAYPDVNPMTGQNVVSFTLDPRGGQQFGTLTEANVNRQLCIVLDDKAMSFANIRERITDHCQISGGFTPQRVQDLVRVLDAGSLPARVKDTPLAEQTIGPSLGATNRTKGVNAAIWGALLVFMFVFVYYGIMGGGVANFALALNLLFVLAAMALMQATFTLPGIAGLILTVGMAIDANVLIFERIREERERGVVIKKALNAGYEKAFSTIVDANLTTLLTCIILGFVGSEEVKGFAIVLGIGITTSMFTALFVTRLVFNTFLSWGWLTDLFNLHLLKTQTIDWVALRGWFWSISGTMVVLGVIAFAVLSETNKQAIYDIEFLGGTSVQLDLKPAVTMTDEQVGETVTSTAPGEPTSVNWLRKASQSLLDAEVRPGESPGTYVMSSTELTGGQIGTLMNGTLEDELERNGIAASGRMATFTTKAGQVSLDTFKQAVERASRRIKQAAEQLRGARVQIVSDLDAPKGTGESFELVTTETDRAVVQAALVGAFGDRLNVQRGISFKVVRDEKLLNRDFFVIEQSDRTLADVIGGDALYDVRPYRGGVAIEVKLDDFEPPISVAAFERRMREVALQPEFEQFRRRASAVYPLGESTKAEDGTEEYRNFAVVAVDESIFYGDDPVQWEQSVAQSELNLVKAALGSEKSLSKVVSFAPQIAGQTKNRAIVAIIFALLSVISYLWIRFGTKEYGLAAIVALVHDVSITLGGVAVSYWVFDHAIAKFLLIDNFKIDLPMIAAILTVIGYSLNDTIVVFDRIRENKGKVASLSPTIINSAINQTLSRTILTSFTTFIVVAVLYVFGGAGVHGFSFALLIGVVFGTYSSIAIASPFLYNTVALRIVCWVISATAVIGVSLAEIDSVPAELLVSAIAAAIAAWMIFKAVSPTADGRRSMARA